jgi:hypothetical protein
MSELTEVDATILEIQVETYFQGHVLGSFVLAEDGQGYEAVCERVPGLDLELSGGLGPGNQVVDGRVPKMGT